MLCAYYCWSVNESGDGKKKNNNSKGSATAAIDTEKNAFEFHRGALLLSATRTIATNKRVISHKAVGCLDN